MNYARAVVVVMVMARLILPAVVSAADTAYSIRQMTPAGQGALDRRKARYDELRRFKEQGSVGENNRGYVEVVQPGDIKAEEVVNEENSDRAIIYRIVAEQNNLSSLAPVEKTFADVQRAKAQPGEFIQTVDGSWVRK